jgi:hypothetical protein
MSEALRPATHPPHYAEPPQMIDSDGSRHWIIRAGKKWLTSSPGPIRSAVSHPATMTWARSQVPIRLG